MKCSAVFILLLLLGAPHYGLAQTNSNATTSITSRLEQLRAKGSDALFNLDYEAARQAFKQITREFPEEPVGPRMLAWTIWLETLNRSRLKQGAIYSSQSFEATADDKPDLKTVQEFRDLTRQATQLARARWQRNPHDPQTLYELGSVEILKASFALTSEGRYLSALRDASTGIDREREAIKLDPNFHDAELTIGLYDYVLGSLPLPAKMVASLVGVHGSKKRGVQTLERVANEGHWERDDAKLLIMALYKSQKRFPESLELSRDLQQKYPRNYLFKLETADTLVSQAVGERQANRTTSATSLQQEVITIFDSLLNEHISPRTPERAMGLIHFRYGEALFALGELEAAARQFLAATTVRETEGELVTRAHLRAAQSLDLAGKRNEALAEYRTVTSRPNAHDSQEQARRGLKEPYRQPK